MEERISRREFFKRSALITAGAGLMADFVWSSKIFSEKHVLTPAINDWLNREAISVSDSISTEGFERKFKKDGKIYKAQPNIEAFARALQFVAYADGGEEEVNTVNHFIKSRGLIIAIDESPMLDFAGVGGTRQASLSKDTPNKIGISSSVLQHLLKGEDLGLETVVYHEQYHLVQEARDSNYTAYAYAKAALYVVGPLVLGIRAGIEVGNSLKTRRQVLKEIVGVGSSIVATAMYFFGFAVGGSILTPMETQAYNQTEAPWGVINDALRKNVEDKFFTFQQVEN